MFGLNFATVSLVLLGVSVSNASPLERRACPSIEIIDARGTGQPQGSTSGYTGMLTTARNTLGAASYSVNYPASADFYNSIQAGVSDLRTHIFNGITFCPNQNYAFIGYSQGAEVMNNYLQNVNSTSNANIYNRIKAIVYIGNPSHSPYNPTNFDENSGNTTNPFIGGGILGVRTPPLTPYISSRKLHDICYTKDIICGVNQTDATLSAHVQYDTSQSVQTQGANFIVSQLS